MVGGWFDTVGIGFLTILILVPYLLDDAVGLIPVLQELSIILALLLFSWVGFLR